MAGEIFISYRRSDQAKARLLHGLLQQRGVDAWYDAHVGAGEDWRVATAKALERAPIFVLLFSRNAADSDDIAKELAAATYSKKLVVPVRIENLNPTGAFLYELASRNWFDAFNDVEVRFAVLADSLAELVKSGSTDQLNLGSANLGSAMSGEAGGRADASSSRASPAAGVHRNSVCVLPFANMSGDAEQEYFSDGITEDVITDLSKVSALFVVARNTAFQFKGKNTDILQIARQLNVSHVLEGSVRKSGGRVRITAQLIDGRTGGHVWAERFDRDLQDIFALQDEISEAIVTALKLKLLPEEKKAIELRGTENVEAYNLYLMARQTYVSGNENDARQMEGVVRICKRVLEIDPNYAQGWALMALGQMTLRFMHQGKGDDGMLAAERALALDANLAEAHAVKARISSENGDHDAATSQVAVALRLDPESHEVNRSAAHICFKKRQLTDAIRHFEKAVSLVETDFSSAAQLISCYNAVGDSEGVLRSAQITLARTEKVLASDPNNGRAIGYGSNALACLGRAERAKEWMNRAILIDPENWGMRYNFACALVAYLKDRDGALDLLEPVFANISTGLLMHAKVDPDFDSIRDDPRFVAMVTAAEARLAGEKPIAVAPAAKRAKRTPPAG